MAPNRWVWALAVVTITSAASAVALMTPPGAAAAGPPPLFVVDEGPYEPADGELTLEVINLSDGALTLELESPSCGGTSPQRVAGHTRGAVTFELAAGCDVEDPVTVTVAGSVGDATDSTEITLTAAEEEGDADFVPLFGFAIGIAAALVLTLGVLVMACGRPSSAEMRAPMTWLDEKWSFDESWAATTGLAAALFTGLFGATDVLKELVGEDTDVAVAVVAAAAAAGLVGAAPMWLAMFQSGGKHTRWGVALGTWSVLSAHIGLIITLGWMLHGEAGTGVASKVFGAGAILVLALYTVVTLPSVLTTPPPDDDEPDKTDEVKALEEIAVAVNRIASSMGVDLPAGVVLAMDEQTGVITPTRRRRAALI